MRPATRRFLQSLGESLYEAEEASNQELTIENAASIGWGCALWEAIISYFVEGTLITRAERRAAKEKKRAVDAIVYYHNRLIKEGRRCPSTSESSS